jgi:hypothetical protein
LVQANLQMHGFSQQRMTDYFDIFSPASQCMADRRASSQRSFFDECSKPEEITMNSRNMIMTMVLVLALPAAYAAADPASPTAGHAGTPTLMMHGTVLAAGGMMGGGMSGGSGGGTMGGDSGGMKNGSGGGTMGGSNGGMSGGSEGDMSGGASGHGNESIKLKNGSMLSTDAAGDMMMTDAHGRHMDMKDGEIMETEDGRTLMMRNNALWQRMPRGTLNPKVQ